MEAIPHGGGDYGVRTVGPEHHGATAVRCFAGIDVSLEGAAWACAGRVDGEGRRVPWPECTAAQGLRAVGTRSASLSRNYILCGTPVKLLAVGASSCLLRRSGAGDGTDPDAVAWWP